MVIVYKSSQWQNPFILGVCTGNVDRLIPQSPWSLHWAWVASHVVEIFQRTKNRFVTTAIFLPEQMLRKCGPGKYENIVWSSNDIPGPMCGAYHLAMHISYTEVISIDIYYGIMFIFNEPIFIWLLWHFHHLLVPPGLTLRVNATSDLK